MADVRREPGRATLPLREHLVAAPRVAGDVERRECSVGGDLASRDGPRSPDRVARQVGEVPRDERLGRRTATTGQRQRGHRGRSRWIWSAPAAGAGVLAMHAV